MSHMVRDLVTSWREQMPGLGCSMIDDPGPRITGIFEQIAAELVTGEIAERVREQLARRRPCERCGSPSREWRPRSDTKYCTPCRGDVSREWQREDKRKKRAAAARSAANS